jgi:hypothetical protein
VSLTLPTLPAVTDTASSETAPLPVPPPEAEPVTDRLPRVTAQPVFVDATGRRLRRLRRIGALVGLACVGYLVVLAAAVGGGVVDPVTSGLPLSDAVAPLAADPATTTTSTSRATTRSPATTTRATAARSTAAVPAAAVPTTSAAAPTTVAPTSAPATTTSAPTSTSAPTTDGTETGTPQTSATGDTGTVGDGAADGSDAS